MSGGSLLDKRTYIESFLKEKDPLIQEMEAYAEKHRVPIMDQIGIHTFIGLLQIQRPTTILEIGTAIGYSAIRLAEALPESTIFSIERDEVRYKKAVEYCERSSFSKRIYLYEDDALEFDIDKLPIQQFDAVFIDAAKGQYQRFFEKYAPLVKQGGILYCDNMFMHGHVYLSDDEIPKRNRTMIRNLKKFTTWIMDNKEFDTSILGAGDGLLVAIKK